MKSLGIVRRVDELGRIVLPSELRRLLGIGERDALEIYTNEDQIILKKYEPTCIFLGIAEDLIDYKGRKVSKQAIRELAQAAGLKIKA